jgi:hypothetical protein
MVKTEMNVSDMMAQPHYRSIFTLTNEFDRGEGLQQIHYRYALVENPDIPKHYQKKMKKHFGKWRGIHLHTPPTGKDVNMFFNVSKRITCLFTILIY